MHINTTHTTPNPNERIAYSVREVARLVGVCERKIQYEIQNGKLRISRVGRRVLIRSDEVNRWLNEAEG